MLIVKPFNTVFITMLLLTLFLAYLTSKLDKLKARKIIAIINIVCAIWLLAYKNLLVFDKEYVGLRIASGVEISNFYSSLPFHFCNMLLFITPYALYKRNDKLIGFCMWGSLTMPLVALAMPSGGFSGYSLLTFRIFSFYIIHFAGFYTGLALLFTKIHVPDYKDIIPTVLYVIICYTVSFIVSFIILKLGLNDTVNFFYSMGPKDNYVLKTFYKLIPIPYIYNIPIIILSAIPLSILTFIFKAIRKMRGG